MRRQPQARQSKQKARQDAFYKLEKSTKPRVKDPTLELSEDGQRRLGGNILKMRNVSLSFGDKKMLSDFSYDFNKGDRIGIVGRNGVGKVSSDSHSFEYVTHPQLIVFASTKVNIYQNANGGATGRLREN